MFNFELIFYTELIYGIIYNQLTNNSQINFYRRIHWYGKGVQTRSETIIHIFIFLGISYDFFYAFPLSRNRLTGLLSQKYF